MSEDKQVSAEASDGTLSDESMESVSGGLIIGTSPTIPIGPPPTFPTDPIGSDFSIS